MSYTYSASKFQPGMFSAGSLYGFDIEPPVGEQAVWRAVITQAVMDARSNSHKSEAQRAKLDAVAWFDSDDFAEVCELAGMEPDYTRWRIQHALDTDMQWRLPAGQGWRTQARKKLADMETVGNA